MMKVRHIVVSTVMVSSALAATGCSTSSSGFGKNGAAASTGGAAASSGGGSTSDYCRAAHQFKTDVDTLTKQTQSYDPSFLKRDLRTWSSDARALADSASDSTIRHDWTVFADALSGLADGRQQNPAKRKQADAAVADVKDKCGVNLNPQGSDPSASTVPTLGTSSVSTPAASPSS